MTEKQLNLKYLKERYKHPTWEAMLEISSEQYIRGLKQGKFDCEMDLINLQQIEQEHQKINGELREENKKYKEVIDKAIDYLNKYAWQEDIIGGIYTTTGKPAIDRYMQLEWDNCNELLDILKEVE